MFTIFRKSMVAAICLITFNTIAQETLSEIMVTTSKLPQKESRLTKSILVINDSTLQAHSAWTLSEILQKQAGISIVGSGQPMGSLQSIYTRGGNSGQTLLLLDGIPLYDPSSTESNFDLNLINLEQIERIEILKGGQSTIYGSDAMAGVINFISKKGGKKKLEPIARLSYGSFNTLNMKLGLIGDLNTFSYNIGVNQIKSDGFSTAVSDLAEEERDGYMQTNYNVQLAKKFEVLNLGVFGRYSDYSADLDAGAMTEDMDYRLSSSNLQYGLYGDWKKEKYEVNFNYHFSNIDRKYEDDSTYVPPSAFSKYSLSTFESKSHFIELFGRYSFNEKVHLLLGMDNKKQSIAQTYYSVSAFGPYEEPPIAHGDANTNNFSAYTSLQLETENGIGIELGSRFNSHSEYGAHFSYSLNPYFELNDSYTFYGIYATSFKNPSLYQLYSPYGNLELEPEESRNMELGFRFNNRSSNTKINLALFNRKHENIIGFENLSEPPYGIYKNIDAQQTNGVETSLNQSLGKFSFDLNYIFLNGYNRNESLDIKKYNLIRKPKHQIGLGGTWSLTEKLLMRIDFQYLSKRYDQYYDNSLFTTVDVDLEAYSLIDFNVQYRISARLRAFASVFNLFDKTYTEVYGYNSQKRNFRIGLTLN